MKFRSNMSNTLGMSAMSMWIKRNIINNEDYGWIVETINKTYINNFSELIDILLEAVKENK